MGPWQGRPLLAGRNTYKYNTDYVSEDLGWKETTCYPATGLMSQHTPLSPPSCLHVAFALQHYPFTPILSSNEHWKVAMMSIVLTKFDRRQVTDPVLKGATRLYSSNYGKWDKKSGFEG